MVVVSCRFKDFVFDRADKSLRPKAHELLKGNFKENFMPDEDKKKPATTCNGRRPPPALAKPAKKKKKLSAAAALLMGDDDDGDAQETPITILDEVERYLALPQQKMVKNGVEFNLLLWWKDHESELPNLSRMARQYLALPASSCGAERLFSAAGRMHDDFRKSTKEVTLSHLLQVYKNMSF